MPHFLLTFGDANRPPVGAVIIEAPSMFHARMTAVVRSLAPGVPFGEALKLTARTATGWHRRHGAGQAGTQVGARNPFAAVLDRSVRSCAVRTKFSAGIW
jgi:hypothetical protein